jgi:site-specific recombinase XerD
MHRDVFDVLVRRREEAGFVFLDDAGSPFNHARLHRRLVDSCKTAGLREIGWHALRHTFASHLAMQGVPLGAVQVLLGHSSITITMRYAHLAPATLRSAVDLLTPERGGVGQPVGNRWLEAQKAA